jgi:hypothetical protein
MLAYPLGHLVDSPSDPQHHVATPHFFLILGMILMFVVFLLEPSFP